MPEVMRKTLLLMFLLLPLSACGVMPETTAWDSFDYTSHVKPAGDKE